MVIELYTAALAKDLLLFIGMVASSISQLSLLLKLMKDNLFMRIALHLLANI